MKWITLFALAAAALAQEPRTFVFTSKFEFEGKVVQGAPYAAQAVTETTQVLPDGNRITRKTSSFVARDSQGRTRREQNLKTVGPWSAPESESVAFISDPVAGVRYTLDMRAKTAVKLPLNENGRQIELEAKLKAASRAKEAVERRSLNPSASNEQSATPKTEMLGTKSIEGVVAEGKRVTETIPAGKIGNEKPIEIVNETWYSSDLQIVVMSRHSDPRSGDVVYTLTNINRSEPDPAIFTIPADYRIKAEGNLKVRE